MTRIRLPSIPVHEDGRPACNLAGLPQPVPPDALTEFRPSFSGAAVAWR